MQYGRIDKVVLFLLYELSDIFQELSVHIWSNLNSEGSHAIKIPLLVHFSPTFLLFDRCHKDLLEANKAHPN